MTPETIKSIRTEIDSLSKLSSKLKPSREISLAKTSFDSSKMMLGKVLEEMGTENPYPESKNPNSPIIEKTADTGSIQNLNTELDHIGNVKAIRLFADEVCNKIKGSFTVHDLRTLQYVYTEAAFLDCSRGMMWLGMELGRIRDEEEATKK